MKTNIIDVLQLKIRNAVFSGFDIQHSTYEIELLSTPETYKVDNIKIHFTLPEKM